MKSINKKVFILTWCKDITQLYGSTLFFDTIRIGFPTAELFVIDNNSIDSAKQEIFNKCKNVNAKFFNLKTEVTHHFHIRNLIFSGLPEEEIFIVDPDVIFWDDLENINNKKLVSGRLIPEFKDPYTGTITRQRLHTSLLRLSNLPILQKKIREIEKKYFDADLISPIMVMDSGKWFRWDTTSQLYAAIKDDCFVFNDEVNDKFDHIFCGTHLNIVTKNGSLEELKNTHKIALENPKLLKGIWRKQHDFFLKRN